MGANFASPIILEQSGDRVTGTYQNGGGYIDGVINEDRLNYEWRDSNGYDQGTGYFTISSDGDRLDGKWYSSNGDSGDWEAWRGDGNDYDYDNNNYDYNYYDISGSWKSSLGDISLRQEGNTVEGYFGSGKVELKVLSVENVLILNGLNL